MKNDATPRRGGIAEVESLASINSHQDTTSAAPPQTSPSPTRCVSSQAVSWWEVCQYVAPVLARLGSFPMAGSVEWCALADDDPRKIAAIFDAAQHWVLRVEMGQEALAQASHDISAAEDWADIADEVRRRQEFHADHSWAQRRSA